MLSHSARVLFAGLWVHSDDHGAHPACPRTLRMCVFPADQWVNDDHLDEWVGELLSAQRDRDNFPLVIHYLGDDGQTYLCVTGLLKQQKIDKPTYKHPHPPDIDKAPLEWKGRVPEHVLTSQRPVGDSSESGQRPDDGRPARRGEKGRGVKKGRGPGGPSPLLPVTSRLMAEPYGWGSRNASKLANRPGMDHDTMDAWDRYTAAQGIQKAMVKMREFVHPDDIDGGPPPPKKQSPSTAEPAEPPVSLEELSKDCRERGRGDHLRKQRGAS